MAHRWHRVVFVMTAIPGCLLANPDWAEEGTTGLEVTTEVDPTSTGIAETSGPGGSSTGTTDASSSTGKPEGTDTAGPVDGLVVWYLDDDPADGTLADATGLGHDAACTLGCPALVPDGGPSSVDAYFSFAGAVGIQAEPSAFIDDLDAWSMTVWLRPLDTTPGTDDVIATKTGLQPLHEFAIEFNQNEARQADCFAAIQPDFLLEVSSVSAIEYGEWAHVACVFDGVDLEIFVNGVLEGTTSLTAPIEHYALPLLLGHDKNSNQGYDGSLADFRLYDRALSDDEVQALAQ